MTVTSVSWELQKAINVRLKSDVDAKAYLGDNGAYDDVQPMADGTLFAIIGDDEERSLGEECDAGSSHTFAITVFSAKVGYEKTKLAAQAIRNALTSSPLSVSGYRTTDLTWQSTSNRRNPDQATWRQSTMIFEVELRPISS